MSPLEHRELWLPVLAHLAQAGMVILALWAIDRWLLRAAPARHQSVLWGIALTVLVLPASLVGGALETALRSWAPAGPTASFVTEVSRLRAVVRPDTTIQVPLSEMTLPWQALSVLWAAGVVLLLIFQVRRRAAAPAVCTAEPVKGKRLAEAARRAGLAAARLAWSPDRCMPHARGLLRRRVVLPEALVEALDTDELAAVIAHEAAHLRRFDTLRRLGYRIVFCVFWFFPLTWLVLRRLDRAAELACDEAVLRAGFEPSVYARALARTVRLGLSWPDPAPALVRTGGADIPARLDAIRRAGKETSMKRNTIAVVLAGLVMASSMTLAAPPPRMVQDIGAEAALERYPQLRGLDGVRVRVDIETEGSLGRILHQLADSAGFEVEIRDSGDDSSLSLLVRNTTAAEVLAMLADNHGLALEVPNPGKLVVRRFRGPVRLKRYRPDAGPYRVGGDIEAPEKLIHVAPEYSSEARRARLEGVVILEARIDEQGDVVDVDVLRGLGLGLDEAAVAAVREWKYTPTLYDGEAVEVLLTVTVSFSLSEGP